MKHESRIMKKDKNTERISSHDSYFIPRTSYFRGFTMVEVLVTLSIFTVISGVVLARYKDFSGGIILSNLAYEVAITIRQAQVYGLSVKNTLTPTSNFNLPYGIHLPGPVSNSFVFFADVDGDGYDSGESGESIEILTTKQGNTIQSFCATPSSSNTPNCDITYLDITFLRPEPDAKFKTNLGTDYKEAIITVSSPGTLRSKTIRVKSTGQISVQ